MKKFILLSVFIAVSYFAANAQYKTAVGLRLGYPVSISAKHFVTDDNAVEVYAGARFFEFYNWFNVSAAYQIHKPLEISEISGNLRWYYGFGASAYFWSWDTGFLDRDSNVSFGVQGYIGLDYAFENTPLNLSLDWVPSVFINGFGSGFGGGYGALSARYILNQ